MAREDELAEFRCLNCGATTLIHMPGGYVALTVNPNKHHPVPIGVPTCTCAGRYWVRVGSMTEYYKWHARADVCRICNHAAEGTQAFSLHPRGPRAVPEPGKLQLESIVVHACPEHVAVLRTEGVMGFFLIAVLALAACSSSHSSIDAPPDPVACKAALEATLDRTCTLPSDCMLVDSEDCCGTIKLGVHAAPNFAQNEAAYATCLACGARGCQHADLAEDGMAPGAGQAIVPTCVDSRCSSTVRAPTP